MLARPNTGIKQKPLDVKQNAAILRETFFEQESGAQNGTRGVFLRRRSNVMISNFSAHFRMLVARPNVLCSLARKPFYM